MFEKKLKEILLQSKPELQEDILAIEQACSLDEIEKTAWKFSKAAAVWVIEETLSTRAQAPTERLLCPQCGERLQSKGFAPRQMTTIVGTIGWKRRILRCPGGCGIGQIAPSDHALQIRTYQAATSTVRRLVCLLAVFLPFNIAAFLMQQFLNLKVSTGSIWNWVQEAGSLAMHQIEKELRQIDEGNLPDIENLPETINRLPLLIGGDGVMVPFRPNPGTPAGKTQWKEVKIGILARLTLRVSRTGKLISQLVHKRVVAVLGCTDEFGVRLLLEALRQSVATAPQVVWVSDGARGLWNLFSSKFSAYAVGVPDFFHAAQNLWKAAATWFDGRTTKARRWFDKARHDLRHGECCKVIENLKQAALSENLPDDVKNTIRQVAAYLEAHRTHMDYDRLKEMGLPIGSGFVESTCKWLIQQRFKGVGMRWSVDGFNNLLHLRLAYVNGRFDLLFQEHLSLNH